MKSYHKVVPTLAVAMSLLAFSALPALAKATKNQKTQSPPAVEPSQTTPPTAVQPAGAAEVATSTLMQQIFGSLGKPTIKLKADLDFGSSDSTSTNTTATSSKGAFAIEDLEGLVQLPLNKPITVPFGSAQESSENAKFSPKLTLATDNLMINLTSVKTGSTTDPELKSNISFTKNGRPAALDVKVNSTEMDFISFEIRSIDFETKGLLGTSDAPIILTGSCGLKQSLFDQKTRVNILKDTQCTYNGTYNRTSKKYKIHFHYDSMD